MAAPKIALRRIKDLTPDPRNARTHSVEQTATLVGLINRFGWTNPILADDLIRAGHGRLLAAQAIYAEGGRIHMAPGKERGGSILPADTVPVIDCSGWTEDERKAYSLADNQIALQAGWDDELLSAQLEELIAADFDITDIGFDPEALSDLAAGGVTAAVSPSCRTATLPIPISSPSSFVAWTRPSKRPDSTACGTSSGPKT